MSKALIILTCPECGSENVTFDEIVHVIVIVENVNMMFL